MTEIIRTDFVKDPNRRFGAYNYYELRSENVLSTAGVLEFLWQKREDGFIFGPFTKEDLLKFNFTNGSLKFIKLSLEHYWSDETWGEDLVVLKKQFEDVKDLTDNFYGYNTVEFFNLEDHFNLESERLKLNYPLGLWAYYILILAFSFDRKKCFVISFGLD